MSINNISNNLRLPYDAVKYIFSFLDSQDDSKNTRLVCKIWANAGSERMKYLTALGPLGVDLNALMLINPKTNAPFNFPHPENPIELTTEMLESMKNATKYTGGAIVITFPRNVSWDEIADLSKQATEAGVNQCSIKIIELLGNELCKKTLQKNPIQAGTYIYTCKSLKETTLAWPTSSDRQVNYNAQLNCLDKLGFDRAFPHPGVWIIMKLALSILKKPIPNYQGEMNERLYTDISCSSICDQLNNSITLFFRIVNSNRESGFFIVNTDDPTEVFPVGGTKTFLLKEVQNIQE